MKQIVITAFASVMVTLGLVMGVSAAVAGETYTLREVVGIEDALACAKDNGKAARVADITPDGALASAWESFCLVPTAK